MDRENVTNEAADAAATLLWYILGADEASETRELGEHGVDAVRAVMRLLECAAREAP